jgi:hypothetical protein
MVLHNINISPEAPAQLRNGAAEAMSSQIGIIF